MNLDLAGAVRVCLRLNGEFSDNADIGRQTQRRRSVKMGKDFPSGVFQSSVNASGIEQHRTERKSRREAGRELVGDVQLIVRGRNKAIRTFRSSADVDRMLFENKRARYGLILMHAYME